MTFLRRDGFINSDMSLPCHIRFCKDTKSPILAAKPTEEQESVYASVKSICQVTYFTKMHKANLYRGF